jgi:hypothetical protein
MKKAILVLTLILIGLFLLGCTQESQESGLSDSKLLEVSSKQQINLLNKAQAVMVHPEFGFDGRTVSCNTVCSERNSTCIFSVATLNKSIQWDFENGHFNSDYSEDRQITNCDIERKIEKRTTDSNDFHSEETVTLECKCV